VPTDRDPARRVASTASLRELTSRGMSVTRIIPSNQFGRRIVRQLPGATVSRTRPWLALGWECRGRRPSTA
jgi:hypothetical protein